MNQPLEIDITQNGGHHYHQIWRDHNTAVYQQFAMSGNLIGHEVIVIKFQKAKHVFGKDYPDKELYPNSEDWGSLAWSVKDPDTAIERARQLSAKCEKGEFKKRFL